ncbi:zinc finger protein 718-like [Aricia agestis]|uniref:zinc finger protein 718-like n=1 Tax=Aricia agestis TaxID=91739 RepID=UPI001C205EBA|nr:zinc finger protein 718-like [Aricia agestis]
MANEMKDLCRLCGSKDEFLKDLKDENNKNILDMIKELLQIVVNDNDELPTKVCLNCEEKLISFQLFVFECYQVQTTLQKMFLENLTSHYSVKIEENMPVGDVKPEAFQVKVEYPDLESAEALKNHDQIHEFDGDDFVKNDCASDDLSDVDLATLKEIKTKTPKRKSISQEDEVEFKEILKKSNPHVKDFVKMQCKLCEQPVKTWSALRIHYAKTHKSKPYVTCICGFIIKSKSVLYKHVADHRAEGQKYKKSDNCDTGKRESENYLKARNFVNFNCTHCGKQCSSWYSLKSHCESSHKVKPEVRCMCGVTLKSKSVLYKHVQDHKDPNVFCCDKCPRITKTLAAMNKHKMRHVPKSERKFYCQTCNKIFNSKETLKSHMRSHIPIEERKIYECEICHLKFTTRCSAASHKRVVHDKIKSYVCDLCGYACGTGGELRQHRAIHSDDKPFVCNKCSKPFKTYSNLKTHLDTHEDTSYTCYVCARVLNSRRTLKKHLLVHEDKCRYVCSYCNKAFKRRQTLKVHMYTHTGDKPLTCKWCAERFAYASTLRSHRLRCHPDKMPQLQYGGYNAHIAMQEGYMKTDPAAVGVVLVGKNDVEAI